MAVNVEAYKNLSKELSSGNVTLVAVSKLKPASDIKSLYDLGQKDFGENYVQELVEKQPQLPPDVQWHFIGHLQRNKVKFIVPFVHLIHSVDSEALLREIDKQGFKIGKKIKVLLQMFIANEDTKFGFDKNEITSVMERRSTFPNVSITGMMGMASFTEDQNQLSREFNSLKTVFDTYKSEEFHIISTGMSNDYQLAIEHGSNMVRIGSLLFGRRGNL